MLVAGIIALTACSPAVRARIAAVSVPPPPAPTSGVRSAKLMLFGGTNHTVYLGCLNCSEYATDSVKNEYGAHGSAYSQQSIFNHYGPYGSPYSPTSACNEYASDPPVIVDQAGRYFGRLTLNTYHSQIGVGGEFAAWLAAICHG